MEEFEIPFENCPEPVTDDSKKPNLYNTPIDFDNINIKLFYDYLSFMYDGYTPEDYEKNQTSIETIKYIQSIIENKVQFTPSPDEEINNVIDLHYIKSWAEESLNNFEETEIDETNTDDSVDFQAGQIDGAQLILGELLDILKDVK